MKRLSSSVVSALTRKAALACALFLAVACATKQDLLKTKLRGGGSPQTYAVTADEAWSIAKTIFEFEPTEKIDEHREERYMVTSQDAGPLSSGTYLGVFFEPLGGEATKVTFVARRKIATQAYPFLDEGTFHRKFGKLVELLKGARHAAPQDGVPRE